jgi:hypothetical protein
MKAVVYAHQVNTREELLWKILSFAKHINKAMVLCKLACSLVTRVRKSIRADRGHFQQIA